MAAARRASAPLLLLFSLLLFSSAEGAGAGTPGGGDGRATHLHFYFHELFSGGPNGTTAEVSPARSGNQNGSFFGLVSVVDDMLWEGAGPASRLLGRAQGLTVGASLTDGAILTVLNFVFTDGPYNGSTLAVLGRALLGAVMERPIVGGTGAFRMARGYTLSKMVDSSDPENLLILEYDAYVWH
ncbi:hypothetical protein ACP70R_018476 [Stipagrostis hirtigluma subsp. patula]